MKVLPIYWPVMLPFLRTAKYCCPKNKILCSTLPFKFELKVIKAFKQWEKRKGIRLSKRLTHKFY